MRSTTLVLFVLLGSALALPGPPQEMPLDSTSPATNGGWTIEVIGLHGGSAPPDLSLDSENRPHVVSCPPGEIRYSFRNPDNWATELVAPTPGGGVCVSIDVGPNDWPHVDIFWNETAGERQYAVRRDGAWSYLSAPGASDLAVDSAGVPHLITGRRDPSRDLILQYTSLAGTSWTVEDIAFAGEGRGAFWVSMQLDADDRPHVLFYDASLGDVRYAFRNDAGWHVEVVEHIGALNIAGREGSLALDPAGNPLAAYTARTGPKTSEVRYATRGGVGWISEAVSPQPPALGGGALSPSLAVGPGGPVLMYGFNEQLSADPISFNYDLVYATSTPTGWTDEIAYDGHLYLNDLGDPQDDEWNAPQFPTMVLDHCGNPHVGMYLNNRVGAVSNSGVYYATKGEPCESRTVSLDLDPNTLNLRSRGRWVTATLTFDEPLAADVDPASLRFNGVAADRAWSWDDTLTAKVDRDALAATLAVGEAEVCASGALRDGRAFEACDTIRVIRPGK